MRRRTTKAEETTAGAAGLSAGSAAGASLTPTEGAVAAYIEDRELFGISAEFDNSDELLAAAEKAYELGYRRMDAYTPLPIEGLSEALGYRDYYVPYLMFFAAIMGGLGGFMFLVYCTMISYPLNIGGRPLWGWPQWIAISYECTILCCAFTGVFGMFNLNGLPEPYHPMFDAPGFENASSHRFFLGIEARDGQFDRAKTREFMESLGALRVADVPLRK